MLKLVRSLLVWLMVLAVPIQGFAASFMQHCAPAEPPAPLAAIATMSTDRHDLVHVAEHAGHGAVHAGQGSAYPGADDLKLAQQVAAEGAGTCSVCAACCPAIGMPPGVSAVPRAAGAMQALQPPAQDDESFVPGGLDRPPRASLA